MAGLSRAFNAATSAVFTILLRGMTQVRAHNTSHGTRQGPGKRSNFRLRPSHPGKPESYYRRANTPKSERSNASFYAAVSEVE